MLILLGTLRIECVVGKNYRLQDIQLSKIIRGKDPSETLGGLGISPPDPLARFTRSPLRRLAPFRSPELSILRPRTADSNPIAAIPRRGGAFGPPPSANAGGICTLTKVENTGLEPVTSWLQTRRSPS